MNRSISESLQEYGRGVAGGLLFSLPLLYTMEVWWAGFIARPMRLVSYICATFVLLLGYNRYAGLRHDASWTEVAIDSVEEMGLGLVVAAVILWLLGRFTLAMTADEIVGKIVVEAMTVAIGVSVGTAQLGSAGDGGNTEKDTGMGAATKRGKHRAARGGAHGDEINFGGQLVLGACGAFLFAANVAPTEEILMIASEIPSWRLAGIALLSLVLGALILYFSEFHGTRRFVRPGGGISMISGTILTYAIALVSSALILWFFGRFDGQAFVICLAQTVTLGLAATMGASAGRLLLQ